MAFLFLSSILCLIICGPIQEVTTEVDMENVYIDSKLKCDTCSAIAFQLKTRLDEMSKKTPGVKLSEQDATDAMGAVCKHDFNEYEVTNVDGRDRLTGPGLVSKKDEAAELTKAQWLHNLKETCQKFTGEIGEMKMYESYYKDPTSLNDFLCHGEGVRGTCIAAAREDMMYPEGFMYDDFFMPDEL